MTPLDLGPMPTNRRMTTIDEITTHAPLDQIFALAAGVEEWPRHLPHYRFVRFVEKQSSGGTVEMSANRPFGPVEWPTWWTSLMTVQHPGAGARPNIRFRHVRGITTGMEVEWSFERIADGTRVRIVHVWNGPGWPLIGEIAARGIIGPVFVHGIASLTLAGLAHAAERSNPGAGSSHHTSR
jgi:uncharacterized membrane protein